MTPMKLSEFLNSMPNPKTPSAIDLTALGLYHAAPQENGQKLLSMTFDSRTGTLVPAQ